MNALCVLFGYLPQDSSARLSRIRELEASRCAKARPSYSSTPYRNLALWQALLQTLQPNSRLALAAGLTLATARIESRLVRDWKQLPCRLTTARQWCFCRWTVGEIPIETSHAIHDAILFVAAPAGSAGSAIARRKQCRHKGGVLIDAAILAGLPGSKSVDRRLAVALPAIDFTQMRQGIAGALTLIRDRQAVAPSEPVQTQVPCNADGLRYRGKRFREKLLRATHKASAAQRQWRPCPVDALNRPTANDAGATETGFYAT